MIRDTVCIYGVFNSINEAVGGSAREGITLYNPTPNEISLGGYIIEHRSGEQFSLNPADTIGAFGYFFMVDGNVLGSQFGDSQCRSLTNTSAPDTFGLYLGSAPSMSNVVDFWHFNYGSIYHGQFKETSPGGVNFGNATSDSNYFYRLPALQLWHSRPTGPGTVADSFMFGGGGMIDRPGISDMIQDTRQNTGWTGIRYQAFANRKKGWTDRLQFICTAPAKVYAGIKFPLSCTTVVNFGQRTTTGWEGTTFRDSIAVSYDGKYAWADVACTGLNAGQCAVDGLATDSTFDSGVLNSFMMSVDGAFGNVRITLYDAHCTGYVHVNVADTRSSVRTDGDSREWAGKAPTTAHDTVISEGVFIYQGEAGDQRTDPTTWSDNNYDFTQIRITGDTTFLYFLAVMQDIDDSRAPHVAFNIDLDQDAGDAALTWLMADDDGSLGGGAVQRGETNVALHVAQRSNFTAPEIEMYAEDGVGGWHEPTAGAEYDSIAISAENNVMEAAIKWARLGVTLPKKIRFTVAVSSNTTNWNSSSNGTHDIATTIDATDVMTPHASTGSAWDRDLSDADYDYYVTLGFNKDGHVNIPPGAPALVSPADASNFTSSDMPLTLMWSLNDVDTGAAKDSAVLLIVGTSVGATDVLDVRLPGDSVQYRYSFSGGTFYWQVRHADDFGTSAYSSSRSFSVIDTLNIRLPIDTSGGTHDTNFGPTITVSGTSSGGVSDTVQISVNGVKTSQNTHSATGVWSCTSPVTDRGGETIVVRMFKSGVVRAEDTFLIVLDNTNPRITGRHSSSVADGSTLSSFADQGIYFFVVDTGSMFDGTGSCTLYWHVDSGANTNYVSATLNDSDKGTWTISATIPVASMTPKVDTTVGFWFRCFDDVNNEMDSTALSPAYLSSNPGTFTINVPSVRDVVISEIMWNGAGGEYVELFNTQNTQIDLNGWRINDAGDFSYTFTSKDIIPARGYFVVMQGYSQNRFVYMDIFDTGVTGVDTAEVSSWTSGELSESADSITITDGTTEIDSAGFVSSGWPAGGVSGFVGASSRWAVSMERKFTGVNFEAAGYGSSASEWDSNLMKVGHHGRPHGTPGHANSINIPFISDISPKNPVMENGRGKWTITVTNGPIGFSSGRAAVQVPPGWSTPGNTTSSAGYTTVSVSAGSISATSFSGQTVLVDLTTWPASETMTITYGDYTSSGDRRSAARAQATARGDTAQFFLFYDFDGTTLVQVGDSELITYGSGLDTGRLVGGQRRGDTVLVVDWGGATMDTTPASNPNSFINSEYELTMTVSDSKARTVYGAHDSVSIRPLIGTAAAGDSYIREFADFTGLYDFGVNDSTEVGGWTNTNGQFMVTVHVSGISGNAAQLNQFRVTDADKRVLGTTLTYSDSARLPVPVINEVMWAGGAAATDWLELYNPTHAEQSLAGYQIFDGKGGLTDSTANIMVNATVLSGRTLPPFSYLLIGGTGKSPGDSVDVGTTANMSTTETALIMFKNTGLVDQHLNLSGSGNWFGGTNGTSTRDYSMERIFSNRSGTHSTSWGTSDSTVGTDSRGSPRRPNDRALANTTSKFFDVLDTLSGKVSGQTDATLDSNRINFTLRIASGDTQPNQHIGFEAMVHRGPFNYGSISDSSFLVTTSPPDSTNHLGTAVLHVSANSNNFSGTVAIKCRTPYGVPDTAYIVFDRGDSLGYIFQSSETNIFDTSAQNGLLVYVRFSDTFSGLDSSILPQLRWKIGTAGTYTSMADMKLFSADTYLARIDISSNTWAIKAHDTIYWQVVWRDKAGNWDTSPDNHALSSEYIDNTRARDTIVSPTFADSLAGPSQSIQLKIYDPANDYCTITVQYDTYGSGLWTNVTLESGFDTKTNIPATTGGYTLSLKWACNTDLPDTTINSTRLRIRVYDGFDTHTDTSGYFGVANRTPDTAIIIHPFYFSTTYQNTTVVRVTWRYKGKFSTDTQSAWLMQIDTGPDPDWAQLIDSQGASGTRNETRTISLGGGVRYHARLKTWNTSGEGPWSEDTWFWVQKRVMDGNDNDWVGTPGFETDAAYISNGEWIWMDRADDERTDAAGEDRDFDFTEIRVTSDSYFYYFMFRMGAMSATTRPLFSIGLDSDMKAGDTSLNFLGDDAGTLMGQGRHQYPEFNIDYGILSGDSPVWVYRDTTGGAGWQRMSVINGNQEYLKAAKQLAEMAIPKHDLRPVMGGANWDTIRLTIAVAQNADVDPSAGDRTTGFATMDHLDNVYPGIGGSSWANDLSDGDIDFYVDIIFRDTGDVRANNPPPKVTAAQTPTDGSETTVESLTFRWSPSFDTDATDTVTYRFRFSEDSAFATTRVDSPLIVGGETITPTIRLLQNKTYYWMVRPRDNHGVYGAWSDTFSFTTRAYPDTPTILLPLPFAAYGGAFENTTTIRVMWKFKSPFALDTQTAWNIQIDTGPDPDWLQLADSQSARGADTDVNDTRTVALAGGHRYHVRVRTWNDSGPSDFSSDTWFWVPRRVMDGNDNDWVGVQGPETDAASISNGEWIWMDRIGDERGDATDPDEDFDLTEMRVFSDSYYYYFLFRFQGMSATTRPLVTIGIDSDRISSDTGLTFLGDDATTTYGSGGRQRAEFVIDYGIFTGGTDSPIWMYRDTTAGLSWEKVFDDRHEYAKAATKIMELGIAKMDLRPRMSVSDTYLRLTVGIAENNDVSPNAGDRTKGAWTPAHLDAVNPGFGPSAWSMELNDNDVDFYFDISFTDTGDVRRNNPPTVTGMSAVNPVGGSDTNKQPITLMWTPGSDTDPGDTVTYWVRLSSNSTFATSESQVLMVMDSERLQVNGLADSVTYYWQVRARDNHGFYSNWSDTFNFIYRQPSGTIDGDTSDWAGIPSTTAHDTVISKGEWIYTGVNDDQRTDLGDIDEADINQVRISGNRDSMLIMVRFKNVGTTDSVNIGIAVDLDQNAADGSLTWLADEDQTAAIGRAALYGETNLSIHNPLAGSTRIEMFDQGGASWHAGSAQTLCYISTVHDVLEAAVPWKDFSVTLPKRIQFVVASFYNNVDWNNTGNTTRNMSSSPDANDVVTPLPTASGSSWGRDLADNDYDSGFVINFNITGKVNHYADTPAPQVTDSAVFGETQAATVTLVWLLTDYDSGDAKDSNIRVTIRNDWTSTNVFDSSGYGFDTHRAFVMPQKPGWYSWQIRHADDFSTSPLSTWRHFKINTPPRIYITSPVEGDTLGFLKGIQYYVTDSTTVRDTVSKVEYSPDSGANWYPVYQVSGNTQNISADADGETYTVTWGVSRNLFDSSIADARVQIRLTVTDGIDTHVDTVYDLNLNTVVDTGSVTLFVSDRGDSSAPFVGDTDGAIPDIQRAINLLTPANGPDTVVIFQRLAADSWRLTVAVNVDSGMTLMGFREWNRIVNGQNTDTGGAVDTYAKIANSANTSVIYVANVDNVKIVGLILEGDSAAGAAKNGVYLDNSSFDSISLVQIYRMNTAIRLSAAETNLIGANVIGRTLNEGIRLASSSQNNTIRGNQIATADSAGIALGGGSDNNVIRENTIRKGEAGIHIGGSSNVVTTNSILEQRTYGARVDGGLHNRIMNNWITNSATYGMIMTGGAQGNYAAQNDIDSSFLAGLLFAAAGTNHTDTFEANNITRGDTGALNAEGASFDVRYNWWGTASEDGVGDTVVNTGGSTLTFQPFSVFGVDTSAGADTISPNSTTMKTDSTVTATSATIKWDTVTTNRDGTALNGFEGFYVFRWTSATPLWFDTALIDTVLLGGGRDTQYVDTPDQLTTYYYRIAAFDSHYANGQLFINVSALSDTLVISTPSANTAPRDTIILPTTGDTYITSGETYSAKITVKFVILDPDSNFCTVVAQFSKDSGQTWATATLSGTSVIGGLYAPTFGDTKIIVWESKVDVPDTRAATFRFRITPGDGTDTGLPDTTLNFGIDNQRPPIVPQCTTAAVVGVADSGVYVFWAHAPLDSDVRGYYVYRSASPDTLASTRLSGLLTDTTGYKDMSVLQGDTRYYYVTSVDTYDNEGDSSQMEAAPNLEISKTISDSSNPVAIRPGDTITYRVTIRNNGFAPADSLMLFDYAPSNTVFYDSPTALSVNSAWTIHYRVSGASSAEIWQNTYTETATMVRFTRAKRLDPSTATASDTLTIRVKIQ